MPRVKRGTVRRAKRKKLLSRTKGMFGNKSKLYRAAKESADTALKYAFVGRRNKKRDFRRLWVVRINAAETPWFAADLRVCGQPGVGGIVLPKAERAEDIVRVAAACRNVPVLPLIESAQGLWNVLAVAQAGNVKALLFGSLDYQADLGISDDDLLHARSQIVLVSRVTGIEPPVDGVTQAIDDPELLRRDCHRSRQLGFAGKLCIHPSQVDIVNACFAPTEEEVAWAGRVVEGFERAHGNAVQVDGRMVDRPVLLKAQAILREAGGA